MNWKIYFENVCINVLYENFVYLFYRVLFEVLCFVSDGVVSFMSIIDENFMVLGYKCKDFFQIYFVVDIFYLGKSEIVEFENEIFGMFYFNFYVFVLLQFIEVVFVLFDGLERFVQKVIYFYQKDVVVVEDVLIGRKVVVDGFVGVVREDVWVCEVVQKVCCLFVYS